MTKHIAKTLVLTDNALSKYRNAMSNDPFFISWADCSTKTRFPWSSIWINVLKIPPIDSAPKTFDIKMQWLKYTHFTNWMLFLFLWLRNSSCLRCVLFELKNFFAWAFAAEYLLVHKMRLLSSDLDPRNALVFLWFKKQLQHI